MSRWAPVTITQVVIDRPVHMTIIGFVMTLKRGIIWCPSVAPSTWIIIVADIAPIVAPIVATSVRVIAPMVSTAVATIVCV